MSNETDALLTAGAIAKELEQSDAKVKKAIEALGIEATAKKSVCSYYSPDVVDKIKAALS